MADDRATRDLAKSMKDLQKSIDKLSKGHPGGLTVIDNKSGQILGGDGRESRERSRALKTEVDLLKQKERLDSKIFDSVERHNDIYDDQIQQHEKEIELLKEEITDTKELAKLTKKKIAQIKLLTKAQDAYNKEQEENLDALHSVNREIRGFLGMSDSWISKLNKAGKALVANSEAAKKLRGELRETFGPDLIKAGIEKTLESLVGMAIDAMYSYHNEMAKFSAATGRQLTSVIGLRDQWVELRAVHAEAALSLAQLENAIPVDKLDQFINNHIRLAGHMALWDKFGVDVQDSIGSFTGLLRVFNKVPVDVKPALEDIISFAMVMKKSPGEMMGAFRDMLPRLALYTGDVSKNFRKLTHAAHELSVGTDSILGLNDALQTVSGSAEFVGKLGSLWGVSLDPMQMMLNSFDDPLKNIEMIRQAFFATGRSVYDMGKSELRAVAGILGVDPAEAIKLLSGQISTIDFEKEINNQQINAAAMANRTLDIMEKVHAAMIRLYGPTNSSLGVLQGISDFLEGQINLSTLLARIVLAGFNKLIQAMNYVIEGIWPAQRRKDGTYDKGSPTFRIFGPAPTIDEKIPGSWDDPFNLGPNGGIRLPKAGAQSPGKIPEVKGKKGKTNYNEGASLMTDQTGQAVVAALNNLNRTFANAAPTLAEAKAGERAILAAVAKGIGGLNYG